MDDYEKYHLEILIYLLFKDFYGSGDTLDLKKSFKYLTKLC